MDELRSVFSANRAVFECLQANAPSSTVTELSADASASLIAKCNASRLTSRVKSTEGRMFVVKHKWGHGAWGGYESGFARFTGPPPNWGPKDGRLMSLEDGWYIYEL